MPALIWTGSQFTLFARLHTGEPVHRSSADWHNWIAPVTFPGWVVMTSGLSAAISNEGTHAYLFGRGPDNQIWWGKTSNGANWQLMGAVPFGTFTTGPAVAVSEDGRKIHLAATGGDRRMYHVESNDGGHHWSGVHAIGQGTFTSAPAIAATQDGSSVHLFGRGTDYRIWTNSYAGSWQPHWKPIGKGLFTSGPGATISWDDTTVHVMGRGTDRGLWHNSTDGPAGWHAHWNRVPDEGTFNSAPAMTRGPSTTDVHIAAVGGDATIYINHSGDGGRTWDGPVQLANDPGLYI
jgi:hypothetical protein